MSKTIRVSDITYGRICASAGLSGKSKSEVVDDTFEYVNAMKQRINYERVTGCCLRCGSKKLQKAGA